MLASLFRRRNLWLFMLGAAVVVLFVWLYWRELKLLAGPVMIVLGLGAAALSLVPGWVGADAATGNVPPFSLTTLGLLVGGLFMSALGLPVSLWLLVAPPAPGEAAHAALALFCQGAGFLLVFGLLLIVLPRFVLPTQTRAERRRVRGRLLLYLLGLHGPPVLIKNGQCVDLPQAEVISRVEEGEPSVTKPSLALVDAVSAIALERRFPVPPPVEPQRWREGLAAWLYRQEKKSARQGPGLGEVLGAVLYWGRWLRLAPRRATRQWLLARRLIRPRPPKPPRLARVEGPGIVFIEVDEIVRSPLDLRSQIRMRPNIKALTRDGIEVRATLDVIFRLEAAEAGGMPEPDDAAERNRPAFTFNRESAFRAVYGSPAAGRKAEVEAAEVKHWTDLPTFVASDIFRDLILTRTLDSMFSPPINPAFPDQVFPDQAFQLADLRQDFNERVRNDPVLSERGIRVLTADFGRLTVPKEVQEQRLKSWKAGWVRQSVETLAGGDLQRMRIIEQARAKGQYDLVKLMSDALRETGSNSAVLLRFIQALERASANPNTRRLLPEETVRLLNNWIRQLSRWLT